MDGEQGEFEPQDQEIGNEGMEPEVRDDENGLSSEGAFTSSSERPEEGEEMSAVERGMALAQERYGGEKEEYVVHPSEIGGEERLFLAEGQMMREVDGVVSSVTAEIRASGDQAMIDKHEMMLDALGNDPEAPHLVEWDSHIDPEASVTATIVRLEADGTIVFDGTVEHIPEREGDEEGSSEEALIVGDNEGVLLGLEGEEALEKEEDEGKSLLLDLTSELGFFGAEEAVAGDETKEELSALEVFGITGSEPEGTEAVAESVELVSESPSEEIVQEVKEIEATTIQEVAKTTEAYEAAFEAPVAIETVIAAKAEVSEIATSPVVEVPEAHADVAVPEATTVVAPAAHEAHPEERPIAAPQVSIAEPVIVAGSKEVEAPSLERDVQIAEVVAPSMLTDTPFSVVEAAAEPVAVHEKQDAAKETAPVTSMKEKIEPAEKVVVAAEDVDRGSSAETARIEFAAAEVVSDTKDTNGTSEGSPVETLAARVPDVAVTAETKQEVAAVVLQEMPKGPAPETAPIINEKIEEDSSGPVEEVVVAETVPLETVSMSEPSPVASVKIETIESQHDVKVEAINEARPEAKVEAQERTETTSVESKAGSAATVAEKKVETTVQVRSEVREGSAREEVSEKPARQETTLAEAQRERSEKTKSDERSGTASRTSEQYRIFENLFGINRGGAKAPGIAEVYEETAKDDESGISMLLPRAKAIPGRNKIAA